MILDGSHLKRKVIMITCEKNIFFSKENTQYILIHNPLNIKEQNRVKKHIKNMFLFIQVSVINL
jgi:hypothetical protein